MTRRPGRFVGIIDLPSIHPNLSVGRQRRLLSVLRSSFCFEPQGATNLDLWLLIDRPFMETRFYGVRQMAWDRQNVGTGRMRPVQAPVG